MLRVLPLIFAIGFLLTPIACKKVDRALTAIDEAERMFDATINSLNNDSSRWQQALRDLSDKLPAAIQSSIRVEVTQLAERSLAKAGIEFRCNVDFLAHRAVQALQQIKKMLRGGTPEVLAPSFCQVSPPEINLQLTSARRERIEFSGYDMDRKDPAGHPVQMVMINAANQVRAISEQLIGRTTHYVLVLNSGDAAIARELVSFKATKVKLSWSGNTDGLPEVIVRQWTPTHRPSREAIGELSYTPPKVGRGDADFNTHDNEPMSVRASADVMIAGNTIRVRVSLHAREERPDWTEVNGVSEWKTGYTAPAGWKITSAAPLRSSTLNGSINRNGAVTWNLPQGELVQRFVVFGDQNGDEAGTWTRIQAFFNPITVELEELPPNP
jgi:hypothetical protein